MRKTLALALIAAAVGCTPDDQFTSSATPVWEMFPFDGTRTWDFINVDDTVAYKLVGEMRAEAPEEVDGVNVYTVDYRTVCVGNDPDCVNEIVRTVEWSSDPIFGVSIHGWSNGAGGSSFDPPVLLTEHEADVGATALTASASFNWTATFVGYEDCPVRMTGIDWPQCGRFNLSDGDTNPATNQGIVGDYWAVKGAGVVGIELQGDVGLWQLSNFKCEPSEDCDGNW